MGTSTMNISFFRIVPTNVKLVDERYAGGRGETQMFAGAEFQVDNVYNVLDELPVSEQGTISGQAPAHARSRPGRRSPARAGRPTSS